ncbi:hypothetical protein SAMN05421753_11147 [Planctomicrobium piriforme]|uniref:Uncharacterized protein n=1 Tax=Planctomicrobium piriforme TaxID=1576369 RepID=A0A1I3JXW9_9PLAN|nr:hypothetical protein SAMN05421753_11147 [Planctomicrobium piriforme]
MVLVFRFLVIVCLGATVASTLWVYPHQLAYFNEAAGGPKSGWRCLLGSNFDWGQDYLYLKRWAVQQHIGEKLELCNPTFFQYNINDLGLNVYTGAYEGIEYYKSTDSPNISAVAVSSFSTTDNARQKYLLSRVTNRVSFTISILAF